MLKYTISIYTISVTHFFDSVVTHLELFNDSDFVNNYIVKYCLTGASVVSRTGRST